MSTIKVNTLDSTTGTTITVPTGKTMAITDAGALTIGGTAITTGSSNILRKTADYTIISGDVTAKSELVIACNASASNRTITLPAVATSGLSTCIITIVADADATSTYMLKVQDDSSAEVWTGYMKNDFVRLIVSNSVWMVLDHKETYFASFYLTADQSIAADTTAQLTGFTEIKDIGNMWDSGTDRVVVPTGMNGYFDISVMAAIGANYPPVGPAYKISGVWKGLFNWGGTLTDQYCTNTGFAGGRETVTSTQYFEAWGWNKQSNAAFNLSGGEAGKTHFNVIFTRTY